MRFFFLLLLSLLTVVSSLKCYDGIVSWSGEVKEKGLKLVKCPENCCRVTWSLPGTIYSCGSECPPSAQFVKGEKCKSMPTDSVSCLCDGLVERCKPEKSEDKPKK
ncbi:hypothetical protein PFISCL1PPCAC_14596 [Pristionchus fissidentatus]|uniref:Uncharacterized protein n=1 Tax=Pristionchus fissidentatus TaxID=1538716 RepID=A0AAV5VUR2_9BILA|nr:hypothetical protein PFISCL1PPCAC_14596 [Pristionchus fissidentatus]